MKRHRYHLTPHAKEETIPLRTGIIPKFNKVFLDEIEIDEEGTGQQTKSQRDAGKYHILANVWLSEFGAERLPGLWRLVTVEPEQDHLDPPIITLLPPDRSSARSEANLTDFLKKERQKNDKPWLTTEYIAKTLHPLLQEGRIRDQNDLSNHLNAVMMMPVLKAKDAAEYKSVEDQRARDEAERARDFAEKEKVLAQQAKDLAEQQKFDAQRAKDEAEQEKDLALGRVAEIEVSNQSLQISNQSLLITNQSLHEQLAAAQVAARLKTESRSVTSATVIFEPARPVTKPWPSKTGTGKWTNIGIEATITGVRASGSIITLSYIDRNGVEREVNDFGYRGLVVPVFNYLHSLALNKSRAIFLLTYTESKKMRLASDTMMLPAYAGLWK